MPVCQHNKLRLSVHEYWVLIFIFIYSNLLITSNPCPISVKLNKFRGQDPNFKLTRQGQCQWFTSCYFQGITARKLEIAEIMSKMFHIRFRIPKCTHLFLSTPIFPLPSYTLKILQSTRKIVRVHVLGNRQQECFYQHKIHRKQVYR
jgi:hypothetical protein